MMSMTLPKKDEEPYVGVPRPCLLLAGMTAQVGSLDTDWAPASNGAHFRAAGAGASQSVFPHRRAKVITYNDFSGQDGTARTGWESQRAL